MLFLYLYLIELLIRPQDFWGPFKGLPTHWLIVLPAILVGVASSKNRDKIFSLPESKFLLLYTLSVFIGLLIKVNSAVAIEETIYIVKIVTIFYVVVLLVDNVGKLFKTLYFFFFLVIALSQHAIQQGLTGVGWAGVTLHPNYTEPRAMWLGVWDGPNVFALLLSVMLPFALELGLKGKGALAKLFGLVGGLLILFAVYYTNSRGAVLSVGCGLIFYSLTTFNLKRTLIFLLVLSLVGGALLPSRMTNVSTKESSAHQRSWAWEQGIRLFKQEPLLGVGKGQFVENTSGGIISHNNYVQVFSEMGLIGYFLFVGSFWFPLKRNLQLQFSYNKHIKDPDNKFNIYRVINTVFVVFLTCTFFIVVENDLTTLLLGFASAISLIGYRDRDLTIKKIQRADLICIMAIMVVIYSAIWLVAIKGIV